MFRYCKAHIISSSKLRITNAVRFLILFSSVLRTDSTRIIFWTRLDRLDIRYNGLFELDLDKSLILVVLMIYGSDRYGVDLLLTL